MARNKPFQERRKEERQRTRLRSGQVIDLDGRFIIECQFSDISPHGARLRITDVPNLPERFWLFDNHYARALLAQIVWREKREVGVQFKTDPSLPPLDEDHLSQLAGKCKSL